MPVAITAASFLLGVGATCWYLKSEYAPAYRRGYNSARLFEPGKYCWNVYFMSLRQLDQARALEKSASNQLSRARLITAAQLPSYLHDLSK
jgi:hypothetical protein